MDLLKLFTEADDDTRAYLTMLAFEAEIDHLDDLTETLSDRWKQPHSAYLQGRAAELRLYHGKNWPAGWTSLPEPEWRAQRHGEWSPRIRRGRYCEQQAEAAYEEEARRTKDAIRRAR